VAFIRCGIIDIKESKAADAADAKPLQETQQFHSTKPRLAEQRVAMDNDLIKSKTCVEFLKSKSIACIVRVVV